MLLWDAWCLCVGVQFCSLCTWQGWTVLLECLSAGSWLVKQSLQGFAFARHMVEMLLWLKDDNNSLFVALENGAAES